MRNRTRQNTINTIAGLSAFEVLGPNPLRKAMLLSPIMAALAGNTLTSQTFDGNAANQTFTVPAGVTQIIDIFNWGPGGNSGASGAALGGGGGGGGGFTNTGPLTVIPGQILVLTIPLGGSGNNSIVKDGSGTTVANSAPGTTPVLDAAGVGGAGVTGLQKLTGGNGAAATALGGTGAGGGGAAGAFTAGGAAAGAVAGVGGGVVGLGGFGVGGAGGGGAPINLPGINGNVPGGGGGGAGKTGAPIGNGAAARAIIFYTAAASVPVVSLSHRQDVVAGQGALNYLGNQAWPQAVKDEEIGDAIGLPWWIIASIANVSLQIVEYSYEDMCDE